LDVFLRAEPELVHQAEVVDEERQTGGGTDLAVVLEDHLGGMRVVDWRDGRDGGGADALRVPGQGHRVSSRDRPDVDHDGNPASRRPDHTLRDRAAFFQGEQRPRPGGADEIETAQLLPDEQVGELSQGPKSRTAFLGQRSEHGRPDVRESRLHQVTPPGTYLSQHFGVTTTQPLVWPRTAQQAAPSPGSESRAGAPLPDSPRSSLAGRDESFAVQA